MVIANPAYGAAPAGGTGLGTFTSLAGAEQEAADIKRLLPDARVVMGPQATERFLTRVPAPPCFEDSALSTSPSRSI